MSLATLAVFLGIAFTRVPHCDLPQAKNVADALKAESVDACEVHCAGVDKCRAYVFISGWNRCFLKGEPGKQAKLRFYAGEVRNGAVLESAFDRDYSGKDLRRVTHVKSGELCGKECLGEPKCKAFAHLGGYDDCWLKSSVGTAREKVFTCGTRAASATP